MSVVCEQPTISEKLVPYVEGALAEPDRSEVLDHLRSCEACADEVRQLKGAIVSLRHAFAQTSLFRPATHVSAQDLERFALEPETLAGDVLRSVKLHLAECQECEQEVHLLREMEQELGEKVEPVRAPDSLPLALREAVTRQFGSAPVEREEEQSRPFWEGLLALLAGLSPKPLLALGGACVAVLVGVQFMQTPPSPSSGSAVATKSETRQVATTADKKANFGAAAPAATAPPAKAVAATPAAVETPASGDVALLPGRVDSSQLPGLSRKLWDKQVSHSYRDGQIFVAADDVDKARLALELEPREVAAVDLKTKAAHPSPPREVALAEAPAPAPAADEPAPAQEAAPPPPPPPPPKSEVTSRYAARSQPVAKPEPKPQAKPEPKVAAAFKPTNRPVAATPRPAATPAPAPGTETVAVLVPKGTNKTSEPLANPRQQVARVPAQQQVAINPMPVLRGGADAAEDPVAPAPVAPPPAMADERDREKDSGRANQALASRPAAPVTNVGSVGTVPPPAAAAGAGAGRPPAGKLDDVLADNPLLVHARKIAAEAVGESTVSVDKREDGSLVVTVRSGRALNSQELDHLRKTLRQQLSLADSDTVVIRQP